MERWIDGVREGLRRAPRLSLVLGGVLVAAIVAAVLFQVRRPTTGTAADRDSASKTRLAAASGTARVASPTRQRQFAARITSRNGQVQRIVYDDLARECVSRIGLEVLDELINRKVIELACQQRGVRVTDAEVRQDVVKMCKEMNLPVESWYQMLKTRQSISVEQYHSHRVWPKLALRKLASQNVVITEQDIRQAYEHHFGTRVKVRLIVLDNRRRANDVWNELKAHPEDFERIAREHSVEPNSKPLGGLIPPIRRHSQNPTLEAEAFKLRQNEISSIVVYGSPERYAILKCEERMPPDFDLPKVREIVIEELQREKSRQAIGECLQRLRQQTRIDNYVANTSSGGVRPAAFTRPATGAKRPTRQSIDKKSSVVPPRGRKPAAKRSR